MTLMTATADTLALLIIAGALTPACVGLPLVEAAAQQLSIEPEFGRA